MDAPQIDTLAVRQRARQVISLFWPQCEPHVRQFLNTVDSPMVHLALKSLGGLLPAKGRDGLQLVLSYLRGCKNLPSPELQGRLLAVLEVVPDEELARWGGVLAWVLTGS